MTAFADAHDAGRGCEPAGRPRHQQLRVVRVPIRGVQGRQRRPRGIIRGGNVGANGVNANNPTVNICANGRVTMSEGSQLVADTLRAENSAGNPCVFWDVFANRLTGGSSLGPVNSGPTPVSMPVVAAPAFPRSPAIPRIR